ncbi:MAG TPA: cell division ATP-binding protein FtsE [Armatimonadota bacterium]
MIEFRSVSVVYRHGREEIQALQGLDLTIDNGEFVFVIGPVGSGKSTILKLIYREELPTSGTVLVNNQEVSRLRGGAIPRLRRKIGVVFQDYRLLPQKSAYENVAFALYVTGASHKMIRSRVPEVLDLVGMLDRAKALPEQLSGGEQQRVCIARALADNPPILLADEPTGNLDPDTSWDIIQLLERVNAKGTTVMVASHDMHIVDRLNRRVVALDKGTLVRDEQEGRYHELSKS